LPTFRVELRFDLPACRRHRLLEAQAADDPFDFSVDAMGSGNKGAHRNVRSALKIGAVEAAQSKAAAREALQQKRPDMRLVVVAAGDRQIGRRSRLTNTTKPVATVA
jgi:hypothetical protein